jgi:hypothetical protein
VTGTSQIGASATLALNGALAIDGTLEVDGAFVGTGTVSGPGTLDFNDNTTLDGNPAIAVGNLGILSSGAVTLAEQMSIAGSFYEASGGSLTIAAADALTLTGSATLAGTVSGAGELLSEGGNEAIAGGAEISVATWLTSGTATVSVNGDASVTGAFQEGSTSTIDVAGSSTLTLAGGESHIVGTIAGSGTLALGGPAILQGADLTISQLSIEGTGTGITLQSDIDYAGALVESSGTLGLGAYGLTLTGAGSTFAGTVTGTGALAFGGGSQTLASGADLAVSDWTLGGTDTVTVTADLPFAGVLNAGPTTDIGGRPVADRYGVGASGHDRRRGNAGTQRRGHGDQKRRQDERGRLVGHGRSQCRYRREPDRYRRFR